MTDVNTRNFNIRAVASNALLEEFGSHELRRRLLKVWVETDGLVALLLDSTQTASVVTHALRRYNVHWNPHAEEGVIIWVP